MKSTDSPLFPKATIRDARSGQWLTFSGLSQVFCCESIEDILDKLTTIEEKVRSHGLWAVGWISYEASPAFDAALVTHEPGDLPLLWFALFEHCGSHDLDSAAAAKETNAMAGIDWSSGTEAIDYFKAINQIKQELAAGNSYQVNYTFRQSASLSLSADQVFSSFASNARFGAYIDTERFSLWSASPELFFEKQGREICCRPMKGTAARGRFYQEDLSLRDELAASEKNRAENLMIVDMIRNDLSKIAESGSVKVSSLFTIEKYATVWQMTSTVGASCDASLVEIFSALFPCASITGAPKANTMKIIRELEPAPRNLYTGTIGFIRPDMSMQFNVAIRSIWLDKTTNKAEYGVGGGIVWDSEAESEFQECRLKTRILGGSHPDHHKLLETLLWEPGDGYFLLDYHLDRLQRSAQYFDYNFGRAQVKEVLLAVIADASVPLRVRLLVCKNGEAQVQVSDHVARNANHPYRLVLTESAVDETEVFLFHKTTERRCYDVFSQQYPDYDDVLLFNRQGEITESLIANLIVELDGNKYTPPVECGLLAGTYRQYLLDHNRVVEKVIVRQDLKNADNIYLANSLRKTWKVQLEMI